MSIEKVRAYFEGFGIAGRIREFDVSSATVELAAGLIFNRDYAVWDYRGIPGNFCGQICPKFTLLWIPLAWGAGRLYRRLRR